MEFYPAYYKEFSCIAGNCPDSCCKEWEVCLDPDSAAYYRNLQGDLGHRLRQVMRQEDDQVYMTIENGRCPMWRQDGLCQIQAQLGHDALCQTCREFPRLRHEYDGFTERDLELSCPEAAHLIFFGDETMDENRPVCDDEILQILTDTRKQALALVRDRTYSLPQRLTILLLYTHRVQAQIDGGDPAIFDPEKDLRTAKNLAQTGDIAPMIAFYEALEMLTTRWQTRLQSFAPVPVFDPLLQRFISYGIRRYWLQAVSDWDLLCRVKFLITGCILIASLGGDTVQTAQLWSKEIENDADNVDALLDAAYTHPAFTDLNILGLLR